MVLVLNLGLKSIRAIVFDKSGRKLASAASPVMTQLKGSRVEQSPQNWWKQGVQVMKEALGEEEVRDAVKAITVTTSACCLIPIDREGEALRPAMMVADKRSSKQCDVLLDLEVFGELKAKNPNFMAHPSMMLPKAMWLKENYSDVFEESAYLIGSNDYLVNKLCGRVVTDTLNAEKFYYLPDEKEYPVALFNEVGVDRDKLPEVYDTGTDVGEILPEVKKMLGVSDTQNIRCVLSTYDAICAFFGSGLSKEGDASDVSGTVTSLRVLSKVKPKQYVNGLFVQYEPLTKVYIIGGSNNLGGGLIEWAKQALYDREQMPYAKMEREAQESDLGAKGVIFLPYLLGERAPLWDDDARAVFFGLERQHMRADMIRAVFESAGYSLVPLLNLIKETGREPRRVVASGGLARMSFISSIKADILGLEVAVPSEFETTAVGAHILCALGMGVYKDLEEASKIVSIREVILPDRVCKESYDKIYAVYWSLYENLKDLFKVHKDTLKSIGVKKGSVKNTGLLQRCLDLLSEHLVVVFDGISPNPRVSEINAAAPLGREHGVSFFRQDLPAPEETLPILCIPTTAGTGSETSMGAIISDTEETVKKGLRGKYLLPTYALVDPSLTLSVPEKITAETGFDIMTHAIETFVSKKANAITKLYSIEAIKVVLKWLPIVIKDLSNQSARTELSHASMLMGYNLMHAGTCLPHRLQYPLGAHTDCSHPIGLAALYPSWCAHASTFAQEKFDLIAELFEDAGYEVIGAKGAEVVDQYMTQFLARIGLTVKISDLGLEESKLLELPDEISGSMAADPSDSTRESLLKIYTNSY